MSDVVITGVIDGDLSGGLPKAIQVYVTNDIPDLSVYGLASANNGNGGGVIEYTFPAIAVEAGTTLYVASEETGFTTFFGFAPDDTSGAANINGDDAIELYLEGELVDVFGDVNTDGSGEVWEYTDGWASRDPAEGPNPVFDANEWTFSGVAGLDGETTNDTATNPFPTPGDGGTGDEPNIAINEFRVSSAADDDTSNYVELFTEPGTSLEGKTLLVLSGEFAPGAVDFAIDLSTAMVDENGFLLT